MFICVHLWFKNTAFYSGICQNHKPENGTKDAKGYLPIYSVVDKKYTDPATTPLEIVVDAKGCDEKLDAGTPVKIQVDRLEPTTEPKG